MFYRFRRVRKLFQVGIHTEYLYAHDLVRVPKVEPKVPVTLERLTSDDVEVLGSIWDTNAQRAQERLSRGDTCYVTFLQDKPASYHWVQYDGRHFIQPANISHVIAPTEGWIYHVRVADWARGNGINGFVYSTILRDAREKEKTVMFVYTSAKNIANQKGLSQCGFRLVKKFYSLRVGSRYWLVFGRVVNL